MIDVPEPPDELTPREEKIWKRGWNHCLAYMSQAAAQDEMKKEETDEKICGECGEEKRKVLGGYKCLTCNNV